MTRRLLPLLALLWTTQSLATDAYTIDTRHTFPRWQVSHFGFSNHHGQFNKTSGKLRVDPATGNATIEVVVDTNSIGTGDPTLEERLRTPDFFDVTKHPTMTFRSKPFSVKGTVPVAVDGELTLIGTTRPLRLQITAYKCGPHPIAKKDACGGEITGTLKRSEYGMKYGVPALGDDVTLTIQFEAVKD